MSEKIAFMFSGQGSQYVGMGAELLEEYEVAKDIMQEANSILGFDLEHMILEGPEADLNNTKNTQPAIYTMSAMVRKVLAEKGIEPSAVAGHSLGEYSALAAAGVISFADGLKLVRRRGELMDEALPEGQGTMAAIIGLNKEEILEICEKTDGVCEVANYNSPAQIVISGEVAAIAKAVELAEEAGAKKVIPLSVSGAFHSKLMAPAKKELTEVINEIEFNKPKLPFVANVTAGYLTDPAEIKAALIDQLDHSVRWVESIEVLREDGYQTFIEVGPGRVLKGLMRRIDRKADAYNVEDAKSLKKTMSKID